jgi:hypothetical protein
MADLQRYFIEFNDTIRLAPYDENAELREKRDLLLGELKGHLPSGVPSWTWFNQGSYAMNTGTNPKDGNFDIDVGLIFSCRRDRYPDPAVLKGEVLRALERTNRTVRIRRPCVTVEYIEHGVVAYHVDLAVYVERADGVGLDLAVGRDTSSSAERGWEQHDPQRLIQLITGRFKEDEAAQMRRCIRYLKRWRDHCCDGNGPISVALTVAAYWWFAPRVDLFSGKEDDLAALKDLVGGMIGQFVASIGPNGQVRQRLAIPSPVVTYPDLLSELSDPDMAMLHGRLTTFRAKLQQAAEEPLPERGCQILRSQFGPDFPAPTPGQTAKIVTPPYVHTGQSA